MGRGTRDDDGTTGEPQEGHERASRVTRRSFVALSALALGTGQARAANSAPTASFDYSPSTPTPDEDVTFDASGSSDSDGSIVEYDWKIERSSGTDYLNGKTATVAFNEGGTYDVTLTVTDDDGATASSTDAVTVDNPAPDPSFSWSPSPPNPDDDVTFDASGSSDPDGSIVEYDWKIERSSGTDYFNGKTTTVAFDEGGTYDVELTVTDNGEKTATTTQAVTVENPAPTASFDWSPSSQSKPDPDQDVTFDASGSSDPDGSIVAYDWKIERSSGTDYFDGQTVTVAFDTGGDYDVTLTVTDNGEQSTTKTQTVTVQNGAPEANFEWSPDPPNPDEDVTFDASAAWDPDGEVTEYDWEIERSSGTDYFNGETTTVAFDTGGSYDVSLTVTDNGEKSTTNTKTITVDNPAPDPSFSWSPSAPNRGQDVTFDASGSSDQDGSIVAYDWEIERSSGTDYLEGKTTTVAFEEVGTYDVSLTVTDNGETSTTTTEAVTVGEQATATGTPTPTESPTPTATATETPTATPTATPTPSPTATKRPAPTATEAPTPVPEDTPVPTPTRSATPTRTPTAAPTDARGTGTDTVTPTQTPSPTPVGTATGTKTGTPGESGGAVLNNTATPPTTPAANSVDGVVLPTELIGGAGGIAALVGAATAAKWVLSDDDAGDEDPAGGTDGGDNAGGSPEPAGVTGESEPGDSGSAVGGDTPVATGSPPASDGEGPPSSVPSEPSLSATHAAFEKQERIGSGGNADVYRATVSAGGVERTVALKEPRFEGTLHRAIADQFAAEAELWAELDGHEGIVTVLDWDDEPLPWIAMEYMDAGHVGERADGMGFRQSAWTGTQIAAAVEHAHEQGIAHLDLKPANVLFRRCADGWDAPKVADWGLAQLLLEHSQSVEGMSPRYAAPEQFDDERGDPSRRTDVYGLGAVCYHLFTGAPPFAGRGSAVMYAVLEDEVTPPTARNPDLPEAVDEILGRALAKDPGDRYDTVADFRAELRGLYEDA